MAQPPLPSASTLKLAAQFAPAPLRPLTSWLAKKLNPFDALEAEFGPGKEDEIEREHEEEERLRDLPLRSRRKGDPRERRKGGREGNERVDMSSVVVPLVQEMQRGTRRPPPPPVLPGKSERKAKTNNQLQLQAPRSERGGEHKPLERKLNPQSRDPRQDGFRAADRKPEHISVPRPPSPISSFELTGSEFLPPQKLTISPRLRPRVEREMKEAASAHFFNVWPTFSDTGLVDESAVFVARGEVEESGVFVKEMGDEEKENRVRIESEWMEKKERDTEGRRRVKGGFGYESVVERERLVGSEWGFKPSLARGVEGTKERDGDGGKELTETSTAAKKPVKIFRVESLAESTRNLTATRGFLAASVAESKSSTTEKEERDTKSHSEGIVSKKEKSGESTGPLLSNAAARAIRVFAARDHRKQKDSAKRDNSKGNESAETKEKPRMTSQSKPRDEDNTNNGRRSPKPRNTYRPWTKDHDAKDDSEDELAIAPKPRRDKRT